MPYWFGGGGGVGSRRLRLAALDDSPAVRFFGAMDDLLFGGNVGRICVFGCFSGVEFQIGKVEPGGTGVAEREK